MRQGGQRTHAQQSLQVPVCLPRRAGRIDDLVGPAMSTRGPLGCPSQMSRIPPADRQSISRLPQLQPCGPPFSFAISHMARMVYGSSSPVHPPLPPPSPLSAPPIHAHTHHTKHTPPYPSPNSKIHTTTTHTACRFWNSRPGAALLLAACKRHAKRASPRPGLLHRDTASRPRCRPLLLIAAQGQPQKTSTNTSPPLPPPAAALLAGSHPRAGLRTRGRTAGAGFSLLLYACAVRERRWEVVRCDLVRQPGCSQIVCVCVCVLCRRPISKTWAACRPCTLCCV